MAHYIDKDALVAEIERMIKHYNESAKEFGDEGYNDNVLMEQCKANACEHILSFAVTLDVKEVDLEKEIEKYCRKYYNCNYPDQIQSGKCSEVMPHIVEAARRFYELGLKAKQD